MGAAMAQATKTCKRGHTRDASVFRCNICRNGTVKERRKKNPDQQRLYERTWANRNKDKLLDKYKRRYHSNREYHLARNSRWYKENPNRKKLARYRKWFMALLSAEAAAAGEQFSD